MNVSENYTKCKPKSDNVLNEAFLSGCQGKTPFGSKVGEAANFCE